MRGVRIQSIVTELGGEKIDVIEWNPEPAAYIQKALSPARVLTVHPEDDPRDGKIALVVVPDDQLSLAIGREGQNARLAAKLTLWRIDIKGSTESARDAVAQVEGDPALKSRLGAAAAYSELVQQILQRHAEQSLPWNSEELQTIKQLLDAVQTATVARKQAERERAKAAATAAAVGPIVTAAFETADVTKQDAIQLYRARIPVGAYSTSVSDLGLSPRVLSHIERSGLTNVGQIHERLAAGDEAMLVIDGIGPKGLTEIKQAIEDKGWGLAPLPEPTPMAPEPEPAVEPTAEVAAVVDEPAVEAPVVVDTPAAPTEAAPATAIKPAGEGEVAPVSVAAPVSAVASAGTAAASEELDDDEIDHKTGKKKAKRKDRMLVLDEKTGVVVAKKQRKAGRSTDLFSLDEET
jgi:transcription termination/antitermination protein NusA